MSDLIEQPALSTLVLAPGHAIVFACDARAWAWVARNDFGVGASPLAHGLPAGMDGSGQGGMEAIEILAQGEEGRAMLLKGYGNAIVPQVAAKFIRACLEERAA